MIPLGIDLRHLRYYVALSEELHFRRTAERLHISQPPLSQTISRLEQKLGVQLLERTSRRVTPTEAGLVFAAGARKVIVAFELAVAEARRVGGAVGPLRVGCLPHLPMDELVHFRTLLEARDPTLRTEVTYLSTLEQLRRLRIGELDIAIFHRAGDLSDLEVEPVFTGELLELCVAHGSELASRGTLQPDDVRDTDLLVLNPSVNPPLHERFLSEVAARGYRFRTVREIAGTDMRDVILAIASGAGVGLLPASIKESIQEHAIVSRHALDPPVALPDAVLAWRADVPGELGRMLAAARDVARELRAAQDQEGPAA